jgi:methionine biosynthesis protein MetW
MTERPDLDIITNWIEPNRRVLDLGCGDGTLLSMLREHRNARGYGLEIDVENIIACLRNGINVLQTNLDVGLSDFDRNSFDYVVMASTLQAVHFPHRMLDEMLRIGRQGIVTFPNFGYWRNRWQLLSGGHMPVTRSLPSSWYDTPNIHLCTVKDFETLCREKNIEILERAVVNRRHQSSSAIRLLPNLLGEIALYRFQRG